jgi:hypothetical protein
MKKRTEVERLLIITVHSGLLGNATKHESISRGPRLILHVLAPLASEHHSLTKTGVSEWTATNLIFLKGKVLLSSICCLGIYSRTRSRWYIHSSDQVVQVGVNYLNFRFLNSITTISIWWRPAPVQVYNEKSCSFSIYLLLSMYLLFDAWLDLRFFSWWRVCLARINSLKNAKYQTSTESTQWHYDTNSSKHRGSINQFISGAL